MHLPTPRPMARRLMIVGTVASLALSLAACSGDEGTSNTTAADTSNSAAGQADAPGDAVGDGQAGDTSDAPDDTADDTTGAEQAAIVNGASQVAITLEDGACHLGSSAAVAGPVTFTVENVSAPGIVEVELRQDQRILGEKENLAPGLPAVNFTKTLSGGTYVIYCPGATEPKQRFVVSGEVPTPENETISALLQQGAADYGDYVANVLSDMVVAVENLKAAVEGGDVQAAREKYALARPFYEKIESDIEGFVLPGFDPSDNHGSLDYLIDMRASSLDPAVGWHGFHAIERDLFTGEGEITDNTKALAAELLTNVNKLVEIAADIDYAPEDLANGASALLEEVQNGKVSGEEEAFSHIDLLDMAANVEGAEQAFANLKPGLAKIDRALTESVAEQFTAVRQALSKYRDADELGGFVRWTEKLRESDAAQLSKTIQALQDPMSRIAKKVATA